MNHAGSTATLVLSTLLVLHSSCRCAPNSEGEGEGSGEGEGEGAGEGEGEEGEGEGEGEGEPRCAPDDLCDGQTGLCAPSPVCTSDGPCPGVSSPIDVPTCETSAAARPAFDDGPPLRFVDPVLGVERAACVFRPPGATSSSRRPLVVFLHGATGNVDDIYNATSLRTKATTFDFYGDGRAGFVLAGDQGTNQVNINGNEPAARRDTAYRDLATDSSAPDVVALDHLIDTLVAEDNIDPARIHLMGWSNGASFAMLYGLFRHSVPTPGGHRIASIAVFDGGSPFEAPPAAPTCGYAPLPRSTLPVMLVHRACSIVPCNDAQAAQLGDAAEFQGVTEWIADLRATIGADPVTQLTINGTGQPAACAAVCGSAGALVNHVRWPDGVADGGGVDHEPAMLGFLRDHPLP